MWSEGAGGLWLGVVKNKVTPSLPPRHSLLAFPSGDNILVSSYFLFYFVFTLQGSGQQTRIPVCL